ncbi:transcription factor bHLH153-like isoform X2 [Wolffia australiana]
MTMEMAEQKRKREGFRDCGKRVKSSAGEGSSCVKEGKGGVTRRVAALQQLVCPFGKTDTASVLQEAADYITFLHAQLQVLSRPYLEGRGDLRERGLCLVPRLGAEQIARSNGADIWAPNKAAQ